MVLVDAIGDGISSSPSNSKRQARLAFPEFTIRDMVESEHRLATEVLELTHVHAVMGVSMGGMQVFEWVVAYPDFMDVAIPMVGSPQSTSYDKLLWTSQIDALELDPEWKDGNGTKPMVSGFGVFGEIGSMANSSPAYRVAQTRRRISRHSSPRREVGDVKCGQGVQRDPAEAGDYSLDIPGEFASFGQVRNAPTRSCWWSSRRKITR